MDKIFLFDGKPFRVTPVSDEEYKKHKEEVEFSRKRAEAEAKEKERTTVLVNSVAAAIANTYSKASTQNRNCMKAKITTSNIIPTSESFSVTLEGYTNKGDWFHLDIAHDNDEKERLNNIRENFRPEEVERKDPVEDVILPLLMSFQRW